MDYEEKVNSLATSIVSCAEKEDKSELIEFVNKNLMKLNSFGTFNPFDILPIGLRALDRARKMVLDDKSKNELEKIPICDAIEYQSYRCRVVHKLHIVFQWESTDNQEKITSIKKHIIDQMLSYIGNLKCTELEMCYIANEWISTKECDPESINNDTIAIYNALERACVNALYHKNRCYRLSSFCAKFCKSINEVNTIDEINQLIDKFVCTLATDYSGYFYERMDNKTYAIFRHRLDIRTNDILERRKKYSIKEHDKICVHCGKPIEALND